MAAQFTICAADRAAVDRLRQHFGMPRFIADILASRGIDTVEKAEAFLSPDLDRDWLNPYTIPGMQNAKTRTVTRFFKR